MAPFGPRSGPRNPALAPQPRAPLVKQREAWHSWTELTVRLMNLPPNIITWELSRAFASEGNIVFIEIFENRQGNRDGTGRVRFSPPPRRDFWSAGHFTLARPENGASLTIRVEREDQKRLFRIQSPVNKDVWYRETMFLQPLAVRFGVMRDEKTMLSMYEARPGQHDRSRVHTRFKVDLLRNRVTIYFQATIRDNRSVGSPITTVSAPQRQLDRINDYMMTIPLPQLRKLYKVDYDGRHWGLVISLDHPPAFFRKKLDSKASHVSNALVWSEFDAWYRQTDIVYDPTRLENAVVALQKDAPVIDLGMLCPISVITVLTIYRTMDDVQPPFREKRCITGNLSRHPKCIERPQPRHY
jgi:RNA-dependent RNA polymerase